MKWPSAWQRVTDGQSFFKISDSSSLWGDARLANWLSLQQKAATHHGEHGTMQCTIGHKVKINPSIYPFTSIYMLIYLPVYVCLPVYQPPFPLLVCMRRSHWTEMEATVLQWRGVPLVCSPELFFLSSLPYFLGEKWLAHALHSLRLRAAISESWRAISCISCLHSFLLFPAWSLHLIFFLRCIHASLWQAVSKFSK